MRGRTSLALILLAALTLGACESPPSGPPRAAPSRAERTSDKPKPAETERTKPRTRPPTRPERVSYKNLALTASDRRRVDRAVKDLKDLGFWKELTRSVASVQIATRPGSGRILEDGRLADSVMSVKLGRDPGYFCDIMIFSQAIENDVSRQQVYYSQGRLSAPPPTVRQFWAVILAHELAHCTKRGQRGEAYSTIWERRVLDAFGTTRVGTPPD
ncbi:MAG: hypothetical protein M3198_15715 [Actinomycetota bacterium]|nr:hypothetical protein [Actinomycetota bacterium]